MQRKTLTFYNSDQTAMGKINITYTETESSHIINFMARIHYTKHNHVELTFSPLTLAEHIRTAGSYVFHDDYKTLMSLIQLYVVDICF
jgi:hypothetical protein